MKLSKRQKQILCVIAGLAVIFILIKLFWKSDSGYVNCTSAQASSPCCKGGNWYGGTECTTPLGDKGKWGETGHGTCSCQVGLGVYHGTASKKKKRKKNFISWFIS